MKEKIEQKMISRYNYKEKTFQFDYLIILQWQLSNYFEALL